MSVMAETEVGHYENCNECHHPMTAHTELSQEINGVTVSYLVCARMISSGFIGESFKYESCGCRIRNS